MKQALTLEELIEQWRQEHGAHKANCKCWYCITAAKLHAQLKELRGRARKNGVQARGVDRRRGRSDD